MPRGAAAVPGVEGSGGGPGAARRIGGARAIAVADAVDELTTAGAMLADPQIKTGVDLDGTLWGPVVRKGLDWPFLLISGLDDGRNIDPTWASFWAHLRGWRRELRLRGAEHLAFSDAATLYPQAARVL
jgi:hypothetical protein